MTPENEGGRLPVPGDVRRAQTGVENAAKGLARKVKETAAAAWALEQSALFPQAEFEECLLWPIEKIRKVFTGKNGEHIEYRRNTAVYLLRIGAPKEHICALLHMNDRVVDALNAQLGASLAGFTDEYSMSLIQLAGEFFARARQALPEANAIQAGTVGGILMDKAIAIKMISGGDMKPAIDIGTVDERVEALRAHLKQLKQPEKK